VSHGAFPSAAGTTAAQRSSSLSVADWSHARLGPQVPLAAVHCSHAPAATLPLAVSHTGAPPLHARPLSPHEHLRHPVSVSPEQTAKTGPVLVHRPCALLHNS